MGISALIVLDTHVWVWWLDNPNKIPTGARKRIVEASRDGSIYISSISAWEILMLAKKGRMKFTMDAQDWIAKAEAIPFFRFVPVDNAIAVRSVRLPEPFHKDPADRIIVSTAMMLGTTLVSADNRIRKYTQVDTVWE